MKPKTKIQKKVARLSANLRPISATQIDWAYRHCIEHIGYRTKKGNITCSDCGHEWYSNSVLCDTLEGCTCPKCYAKLKVQDTRKRIYKETQYFSVITTCKGYQVIRVAQVRCESRKGEPMHFYCHEVVQRWISPDGKVTDMALLRGFTFYYCDVWALCSAMEIRPHNSLYDDVVARSCAYPKMRVLPQLRRNGFKGDFHGISPVRLFKALLSDPRIETLMKGDEIEVMKHFLFNARTADECWASYLIAKRHKYRIDNFSMWCDYLRMLNKLGQDLRNPKNICPEDFMAAHDNATRKIEAIHEKERAEQRRRWEIERREREQQRQLQREKDAEDFIANKSKFFGLVITDEEIIVKVLESIDEYYSEGKAQNICVFGSEYYKKADTLILSARIGGEIIETVEVDLRTLKVVQCHGKYNQDTEYHERIIDLVNKNANLIREMLPDAKKIGILYTTSEANSVSTIERYKQKVGEYGFELVEKGITNAAEIPQAVDLLVSEVDCISNMTDNTVVENLPILLEKATAKNIPVFGSEEEQVGNGCIASAGIDYIELGKKAGVMAARVLKGEDVKNIPYETLTESKITINTDAAEKIGVTIPQSITDRAEVKNAPSES